MTTHKTALLSCIHGILWQTCGLCTHKNHDQIVNELDSQSRDDREKSQYDYQEVSSGESLGDNDMGFDNEDSEF